VINRVAQVTMEPRGAIGVWDQSDERYTIYGSFQSVHSIRSAIAGTIFKQPENRFRVISYDVGGGFGLKGSPHPEYALVAWAAKKVGRPVKWIGERGESFLSDHQARDNVTHIELALDDQGRFLGLRVRNTHNLGAYLAATGIQCGVGHIGQLSGVYTTPAIHAEVTGVFTNTTPTCAYRGAGRPEAAYMLERVIDIAAAEMKIDPAELRRRNLIPAAAMPYKTGFVFTYDSGEFEKNQEAAIKMADWKNFEQRRAEASKRGKLRGIGMSHVIEQAGGILDEMAEVRFDAGGAVTLVLGTHNHGQGHETTFTQLLVELLGVAPDSVRLRYGDTDTVSFGRGTFGSRSMSVGGAAVLAASNKIIEKGKKIAGNLLEVAQGDIEFEDGNFKVAGTDRSIGIAAVAKASFQIPRGPQQMEAGLIERAHNVAPGITFPNGCHVCEVEIDPETGTTEIVGYWVVDDVGRLVNPMIVKGQLHGGIVQGVGQVFWENMAYDSESGQNLSGSFMDYGIARANNLPFFEIKSNEVLSKNNPLGIKGAGEAGAVGGLPAAMNAVCDALRPLGITTFDMPASPSRVWRAIAHAPGAGALSG
jgi:carbon-monoxide dehydrogenase large subunit